MSRRLLFSLLPLVLLIALPLMLRKEGEKLDLSADQLVIVSPHNESIRYEFEQAFRVWYLEHTGRKVCIDWRAPGGTGDAVRYVNSSFVASFKHYWEHDLQREWQDEYEEAFLNRKLKKGGTNWEVRHAFLESQVGIGIDLFFGGGQYDLNKQAQMGTLVKTGFQNPNSELYRGKVDGPLFSALSQAQRKRLYPSAEEEPVPDLYEELFGAEPQILQRQGGENWYDQDDRYYGTCFSSFGLCQNVERLRQLGFDFPKGDFPLKSWNDLADPRLFGQVGAADPTKSGSINKCFEMMIQREMQKSVAKRKQQVADGGMTLEDSLDLAWKDALALLKKIGGNAAYLTFSASKVPVDVAKGQVAAGMCIDFYGQSQAEWEEEHVGRKTTFYHTPYGESSVSADPIGMFRGAPNPEVARLFLRFIMSRQGQVLWDRRQGEPGGPIKYHLHRLPIRKDCYTPEMRRKSLAPQARPFEQAGSFQYEGAWTAAYFSLIQQTVRVMILDCQDELRAAWKAILDAGGPEKVPEAYAAFSQLPYKHHEGWNVMKKLWDSRSKTELQREWAEFFRAHYNQARTLAKQGK